MGCDYNIEGFWRVMKDTIGAGRCFPALHLLYQRTRQVLYGTSRATHLCVSLVVDSASYFAGAAFRGLMPLIYGHISPYGTFLLDMTSRLNIEPL
jgi:hypothetical protein